MNLFSKFRRSNRGGALIEAAIGLPLLLTLVAGIVNFGFVLYADNSMQEAVRTAARALSVGHTTPENGGTTESFITCTSITGTTAAGTPGAGGSAEAIACEFVGWLAPSFDVTAYVDSDEFATVKMQVTLQDLIFFPAAISGAVVDGTQVLAADATYRIEDEK